MDPDAKKSSDISKYLSYVLRHRPDVIGISLDDNGWADIENLSSRLIGVGIIDSIGDILEVALKSGKKRFTISKDGTHIRAAQGHSVAVDLDLAPSVPPALLFHGTAEQYLEAILAEGLRPMLRQKVHLSLDPERAHTIGQRHGKPVVLRLASGLMHEKGFAFWKADNGVWLVDAVPKRFLSRVF